MLAVIAAVSTAGTPFPPCATGIEPSLPWASCAFQVEPLYGPLPTTAVAFATSDRPTLSLFNHAESCEAKNTKNFAPGFEVVVEGGGYGAIWLETQPMGGASYGVRNLRVALNNQLAFMRTQRQDGRLPGMISQLGARGANVANGTLHPTYSYPGNANHSMLQGFYMATPAVDVAFLMNRSDGGQQAAATAAAAAYLEELRPVLEKFDGWLWSARNSSHGVLWLHDTADTGEDGSDRLTNPQSDPRVFPPFESMDMMGYSHDAQRALARIASLQGDGAAHSKWTARMAVTAASLKQRLWRESHGASFDREIGGNASFVTTLVHNNLRAMWHGIFDQSMADTFVARHLMNRTEFWTPTPLVSISVSDSRFHNKKGNDWSGPSEGLTFQRAIRALENYGHHAEVIMIGAAQKKALLTTMMFPQQIDPFSSTPDKGDCYGPMILAMLEYTALTTGVAVRADSGSILWSSVSTTDGIGDATATFSFSQRLGSVTFKADGLADGAFSGTRNGVRLFECSGNTRVITDEAGVVTGVVGASTATVDVTLTIPGLALPLSLTVAPNDEWSILLRKGAPAQVHLARQVPFTLPFGVTPTNCTQGPGHDSCVPTPP